MIGMESIRCNNFAWDYHNCPNMCQNYAHNQIRPDNEVSVLPGERCQFELIDKTILKDGLERFYFLEPSDSTNIEIYTRNRIIVGTGYRRSVLHSYRWNKKQILKNGDWVVVHSWSKSPVKIGTRFIERKKDATS